MQKLRVVLQIQNDGFFLRDHSLLDCNWLCNRCRDFGNRNHLSHCPSFGMGREGLALFPSGKRLAEPSVPLIEQLDSFFRKCSWAIKYLVDPVSPDGNTFGNWLRHILG